MPSRLRFMLTNPRGRNYYGRDAVAIIRSVSKLPWKNIDWQALDDEGRMRGFWSALRVWRERRGISNGDSNFHMALARFRIDTPRVRAARDAARQRWRLAPPRRPTFHIGGLLAPDAGRSGVRPGIFA